MVARTEDKGQTQEAATDGMPPGCLLDEQIPVRNSLAGNWVAAVKGVDTFDK
jgi:hypothetical protein